MNDMCNNEKCDLSMINGNSIDVILNNCDTEIKADIVVSEFNSVRLWGQVKNCDGQPISNALLKLIKVVKGSHGCEYQGIAHTVSDCDGFYQFDICAEDDNDAYKIIVNKSATGTERIINTGEGNCKPCIEPIYNPCGEYKYRTTPADKIVCDRNPSYNYCINKNYNTR